VGFNKRHINYERSVSALKKNKLEEYYGNSDALFFMDKKSYQIYKLHTERKSDTEILETIKELWTIK
jgi:hypothetical protein